MAKRVLVPTEGSPLSEKALEVALTDYPEAEITALFVVDPIGSGFGLVDVMRPTLENGSPPGSVSPEYWTAWHEEVQDRADEVFEDVRSVAEEYDHRIETILEYGKPAEIIDGYVQEHDIDRVVMGSHCRRGAERFLLGSVAEKVVRRSAVPVTIVR